MSDDTDDELKDHDMQFVKKAAGELMRHFDSVQIFVQRYEPGEDGNTVGVAYGAGNWYTRYGHIHAWLESDGVDSEDFE